MLSSKREYFHWAKQDRMPELSFFRLMQQRWRPAVRSVADHRPEAYRRSSHRAAHIGQPAKSAWTPWLWIGS